jgi:LPS-assembly lipoprotein
MKRGQSNFPGASVGRRDACWKIALTPFLLGGCGFRLRGTADVPFKTVYVQGASPAFALDIKRHIRAGTRSEVVDDPKLAEAIFELSQERREKHILSLTGAGRVSEFQLRYQLVFRVHDGKGKDYVPPSTLLLTRDMSFSDAEVLAKEQEEQILFRDMQNDMVQLMLRRLAAAGKPAD